MSIFAQTIVAICLGTTGSYNEACNKALDAGTRQVGWRQQIDIVEDRATNTFTATATSTATRVLGNDAVAVLGSAGYAYTVIRDKKIAFKLPNLGICTNLSAEITQDIYSLSINWNLK